MIDVSVIIVSWNVRERLKVCLHSIFASEGDINLEVFVVDNASHDSTSDMVLTEFSQVKLIQNTENLGCARALNIALKRSQGRYILWLNPDMRLFPDTLIKLVTYGDTHKGAAVIGARLEKEDGSIVPHVRRFPTIIDQFFVVSKIAKVFPQLLNGYLCNEFDYNKESSVDSIRGSFFCIRREALDSLGLFDERFFLWFEEVDYCKRASDAGFDVRYAPQVRAIDYVGQSFSQVATLKKQKMFIKSMIKYFHKHGFGIWRK